MASVQLRNSPAVPRRPARLAGRGPVASGAVVLPITAAHGGAGARAAAGRAEGAPRPPRRGHVAGPLRDGRAAAGLPALPDRTSPPASRPVRHRPVRVQGAAPLRLTRRGRRLVAGLLVAGSLVAGALVAVAAGIAAVAGGGPGGLEPVGDSSVVVRPGDSLWSIAGAVAPEEDRRAVVDALVEANDLDGVGIVPGQVLRLP